MKLFIYILFILYFYIKLYIYFIFIFVSQPFFRTHRSSLDLLNSHSMATPLAIPRSYRKVISFPWCLSRACPPSEEAHVSPLPWILLGWPFITLQDVVSHAGKVEGERSKSSQSLPSIFSPKVLPKSPSSKFSLTKKLSAGHWIPSLLIQIPLIPQDGPQNRSSHKTSLTAPVGTDLYLSPTSSTLHLLIIVI